VSSQVESTPRSPEGDPTRSKWLNVLVAGVYAWIATVLLPAFSQPAPVVARACALAALFALLIGVFLLVRAPVWGRLVTLIGFVGLSAVTWAALGDALDIERMEPVRAALGGIGWMLFAFGWGAVRRPGAVPERDPHVIASAPLTPRARLGWQSTVAFVIAFGLSLAVWLLAFRVAHEERALLAHAAALACAVALVSAGVRVSVGLGREHPLPRPMARLNLASTPLAGLLVLGMLGLLLWAFVR
jgi:hypothetical protein